MKKLLLLPLALAFASNAAIAANSVDLRVTGTITPSACDISLVGGGTFDLGSISSGDLSASATSVRPAVGGQTLNIACSGATQVAFKAIDNRVSSVPTGAPTSSFGLGMDSANNPIGFYQTLLVQPSAIANGASGQIKAKDSASSGNWFGFGSTNIPLSPYAANSRLFALDLASAGSTASPTPITSASVGLEVQATIQPTSALDTSADITIDGSTTIELVYL